jgi:hypothetical protein
MSHPSNEEVNRRGNQGAQLLALLKAYSPNLAPLHEVVDVAGFQYSARIFELRRLGHRIENEPGRGFRLITHPPAAFESRKIEAPEPASHSQESSSLFGDLTPDRTYSE